MQQICQIEKHVQNASNYFLYFPNFNANTNANNAKRNSVFMNTVISPLALKQNVAVIHFSSSRSFKNRNHKNVQMS